MTILAARLSGLVLIFLCLIPAGQIAAIAADNTGTIAKSKAPAAQSMQRIAPTESRNFPAPASLKGLQRLPVRGSATSLDKKLILEEPRKDSFSENQLQLEPVQASRLIPVGREKLSPVKLEARYNEGISLRQALETARQNNLKIKISQADWRGSQFKYMGSFGKFLPTFYLDFLRTSTSAAKTTIYSTPLYLTTLYPVFLGGAAVFNSLQQRHEMKAAKSATAASINDALLDVYLKYYDLLLNNALLNVKAKAVEVSEAQFGINRDLRTAGLGTDFEVMQSSTLLALDKQRLVHQEVASRRSALQLAVALNTSVMENLVPSDHVINRTELVDSSIKPELLTALAIQNRPELARYEQLRLAARNAARHSVSAFLPQAAFFTNNAINISESGDNIIIPTGGAANTGGVTIGNTGNTNNAFSAGFILNWLLEGAGLEDAGNIGFARMKARRALLESKEAVLNISAQVREAFLDTRAAETDIDVTSEAVKTATEEVRMADLRLRHQLGTNLELIQAQKDYIDALSKRIEAFVNYKQAQARLLYATGLISIQTLTSDHPQRFELRTPGRGR